MLETGRDLQDRLRNLEMSEDMITWLLPRKTSLHNEFKLKGIMLASRLSHKVIGGMLSQEMNVLIVPNFYQVPSRIMLENFAEILYKENMYVIIWNWNWLVKTTSGLAIISKIFQIQYKSMVQYQDPKLELQYGELREMNTLLHRLDFSFHSSSDKTISEKKHGEYKIIFEFTPNIIEELYESKSNNLIVFYLPKEFPYFRDNQKHNFILLETDQFFTEIARELYYLVKQRSYLNIDFSNNKMLKIKK